MEVGDTVGAGVSGGSRGLFSTMGDRIVCVVGMYHRRLEGTLTLQEVQGHYGAWRLCSKSGGPARGWVALWEGGGHHGAGVLRGPGGTAGHYGRYGGLMGAGRHSGRLGNLHLTGGLGGGGPLPDG